MGREIISRNRESSSRTAPTDRVLHSRPGIIRGDDADRWLRQNDPLAGRDLHRRPAIPADDRTLAALEDVHPLRLDESAIYFIQAAVGGPVKIGYCSQARKVTQRLGELQVGNPLPLVVRRAVYGKRREEVMLHKRFADLRVHGEWFTVDVALAAVSRAVIAQSAAA